MRYSDPAMDAYRDDKVHLQQKIEVLERKVAALSSEKRAALREPTGGKALNRQRAFALIIAMVSLVFAGGLGLMAFVTAPHAARASSVYLDDHPEGRVTYHVQAQGDRRDLPNGAVTFAQLGSRVRLGCAAACQAEGLLPRVANGEELLISGELVRDEEGATLWIAEDVDTVLPIVFLVVCVLIGLFPWMGFAAQLGSFAPPAARPTDFRESNALVAVALTVLTLGVYLWVWHLRFTSRLGRVTGRMDLRAIGDAGLMIGTLGLWMFYAHYRNAGALEDALARRGKVVSVRASVMGMLALSVVVPFVSLFVPFRLQNAYNELVAGLEPD